MDVNPENILEETVFCIKNVKSEGFKRKHHWFNDRFKEGLKLKIARGKGGQPLAFIEYISIEHAWRAVDGKNFMFIHCMYMASNKDKNQGLGALLVGACEKDAIALDMYGVAVMTSKGSWIADKRLFEKLNYSEFDKRGRFELMVKKWEDDAPDPGLIDWERSQRDYRGWHLIYADQCPWHEKSVMAITETARAEGIDLNVHKLTSCKEARQGPSGFGVFSLLHDGTLLADHYISQTRFKNILNDKR